MGKRREKLKQQRKAAEAALQASGASNQSSSQNVAAPVVKAHEGGALVHRVEAGSSTTLGAGFSWGGTDPCDLGFTPEELETCMKVVRVLGDNTKLFKLPPLKPLRAALHPLIEEQMKNYDAKDKTGRKRRRVEEDDEEKRIKQMEKEYINQSQLRALRLKRLEQLNEEGKEEELLRIPDGVAITDGSVFAQGEQLLLGAAPTKAEADSENSDGNPRLLRNPIQCYICKVPFRELHFFYDQLCPACASFNFSKRDEIVDMTGKVCLVTGARVKIGYRCALKLLRCGAFVIATSRFPYDTAQRYAKEADYEKWKDRLHVHGLDFRDLATLEGFCAWVIEHYPRLDVIINNACQTVRRPPQYYQHLLQAEVKSETKVEERLLPMLKAHYEVQAERRSHNLLTHAPGHVSEKGGKQEDKVTVEEAEEDEEMETIHADRAHPAHTHTTAGSLATAGDLAHMATSATAGSAALSQLIMTTEDASTLGNHELFPMGATDVNSQQVDLRTKNSWLLKLHEVSTPELAEVFAINAMAPFILNARLKGLMERDVQAPKFIVNVSAMEGKFYRYKSETHPHTNMAKAALNMLTRTSAADYKKSNIYMTAVDTGWINDEKPLEKAVAHEKKHNFQTPLDEIDAAARVLDPVIAPLLALSKGEAFDPPWGFFLKDFMKCEW
eukprot:Colp12_sorted_trinity150504_noHs@22212